MSDGIDGVTIMETVNVKIPVDMRDRMNVLARDNDRTFAAEVRIAIREHLQAAKAAREKGAA
jgi:predicted DNA-binding protein